MPGRNIKKLAIPIVSIVILLVALITTTYTWLQSNQRTDSNGTEMAIEAETYNLIIDRSDTRYNSYDSVSNFKDMFSSDYSYDLTNSSTASSPKIGFELHNEFIHDHEYYLMPGSYGTLTFYIQPHDDVGDIIVNLNITLGGFKKRYEEDLEHHMNLVFDEVTDDNVLNILKGHIMFFTGRTGANYESYKYSGLIENEAFTYNTSGKAKSTDPGKEDCYKVVIYWDWPVTYSGIVAATGSGKKYPSRVTTYINNHRNYFFASNQNSNDEDLLNDGYNEGDQLIGDNVSFLVVYLSNMEE